MRGLALLVLAQTGFLNVVHARKTSNDASLLTLQETDAAEQERQEQNMRSVDVRLRGSTNTSQEEDEETCGQGEPISTTNFAMRRSPSVTSECFKNKPTGASFLTDGDDHHASPKGNKYWASCEEKDPAATVKLPEAQCIRQIRIWPRGDCCGSESDGIIAEVQTGVVWQKCGEKSGGMTKQRPWTFECAIKGSNVRIRKEGEKAKASVSELQIFVAEAPQRKWNQGPKCVGSDLRLEYQSSDTFACDKFHGKGKVTCESKYQSQKYGIANQCRYVQAAKDTWKCLTGPRCMVS